ncbi:MAG: universal stress protein [Acidimicrobiia bacterium]|nr:universal stress protein [Acidimicrobiia bacterium]
MARLLGGPTLALTTRSAPPDLPPWIEGNDHIVFERAHRVDERVVFDTAVECGATYVVLADYHFAPENVLDQAVDAARAVCARETGALFGLVVARHRDDTRPEPYHEVLVGADATPASGFAALVAAHLARTSVASLQISTVERRRDSAQRRIVESLKNEDPAFDPATLRTQRHPTTAMDEARRFIEQEGILSHFEYRTGDPCDVMVRAARYGDHDMLVTGLLDASSPAGSPIRFTRSLLRLAPVDQIVVFDRVTLGLTDLEPKEELRATGRLLLDLSLASGEAE